MTMNFVRQLAALCVVLSLGCGDDGTGGSGGSGASSSGGAGGAPGTGGSGGLPTSASGGAGQSCDHVCNVWATLEPDVMCGYDVAGCVPNCEAAFAALSAACQDEAIAYNDCLLEQPLEDFGCANMLYSLQTTACDDQLAALQACQ
ncbi:MAG: hypothetical protein U0271_29145 [Polyangiaceae bacterium]